MNTIKFFNRMVAKKTLREQADILQKLLPAAALEEILLVNEPRMCLRAGRIWKEGSPRALTPEQACKIAPAGDLIESLLESVFNADGYRAAN
jgi:hypothetical protein